MADGQEHPKNPNPKTAHLKPPWPKGVSGNPGGRPKNRSILKALRRLLGKPASELTKKDLDKITVADLLAIQAVVHATKGRSAYFREIMGQLHGRPAIKIEHKSADDESGSLTPEEASAARTAMRDAITRHRKANNTDES